MAESREDSPGSRLPLHRIGTHRQAGMEQGHRQAGMEQGHRQAGMEQGHRQDGLKLGHTGWYGTGAQAELVQNKDTYTGRYGTGTHM